MTMRWALLGLLMLGAWGCGPAAQEPMKVIFDTDMGPDFDDVGAMAMLHAFADEGKIEILATISSNSDPHAGPVVEAINRWYGRLGLPIGKPPAGSPRLTASNGWAARVASRHPHNLDSTGAAPDAVALCRRILASSPDSSITFITTGFFSNLAALLLSPADSLSPLEGRQLVAAKVRMLVSMAGAFPSGEEFNFGTDSSASATVARLWPGPILFAGYETGLNILTGKRLVTEGDSASPVWQAYAYCLPNFEGQPQPLGRSSWDQTAVWAAVQGPAPHFGVERGRMNVQMNGYNRWLAAPAMPHLRLTSAGPAAEAAAAFEELMMRPPRRQP